jgi:signal peptidase I
MSEATFAPVRTELGRSRARRWMVVGGVGLLAVAMAAAVVLTLMPAFGYRAMVVRSGSMAPAIETGDLIVSREVAPFRIAPGDVVTFSDPSGDGDLVTHRVLEATAGMGTFTFVTKGDANTASETWSTDEDAPLGLVSATLPRAGYVVAVLAQPFVRGALLLIGAAILGGAALLRIWRH